MDTMSLAIPDAIDRLSSLIADKVAEEVTRKLASRLLHTIEAQIAAVGTQPKTIPDEVVAEARHIIDTALKDFPKGAADLDLSTPAHSSAMPEEPPVVEAPVVPPEPGKPVGVRAILTDPEGIRLSRERLDQLPSLVRRAVDQLPKTLRELAYYLAGSTSKHFSMENLLAVLTEEAPSGLCDDHSDYATFLADLSQRMRKLIVKLEREDFAKANRLRKIEEGRAKKVEAAEKLRKAEELKKAKAQEADVPPPPPAELFRPKIPKKDRVKVGIVGLIPPNSTLMQQEFGNTFNLSIALTEDGNEKIRQVGMGNPHVYLMVRWVSHRHRDLITPEALKEVHGGMTTLREQLSALATEVYQ